MGDLNLTFLGTGTSVGIPVIGCDCPVCRSDDPRNQRTRCSLYVQTPEKDWIVDTGPDLRQQCLRENIRRLDAVLITHAHTDHIMGFDDLRRFTLGADSEIDVYARPEALEDLMRVFAFAFNGENRYPGYLKPVPHAIEGPFQLGTVTVSALQVLHGKVDTIGYIFESRAPRRRVAYLPDCKTVPADAEDQLRDLDLLILDALRYTPHPTHMNLDEALAFVEKVSPRRTFFTHISCEIDHESAEKKLPEEVRIAYDGLKVSV